MTRPALRPLGDSGLHVSAAALGGNVFGGGRLDLSETRAVVGAALDLGVNFIDTANVYGGGESEEFLGQALGSRRDRVVVATKFNLAAYEGGSVEPLLRQQLEDSLRRLHSEYIDLYQLHQQRPEVSPPDLLETVDRLVQEGKIRAFGVCNTAAWRLADWRHIAQDHSWTAPATVQNYYHLLARQAEAETLPYAQAHDVAFLPYHPLAGGFLSGKYQAGEPRPPGTRGANGSPIVDVMDTPRNHRVLESLGAIAEREQLSLAELALAWVAGRPGVASVIAGASNVNQLTTNVAGSTWVLDDDIRREIDELTAPGEVPSQEVLPYGAKRPTRSDAPAMRRERTSS